MRAYVLIDVRSGEEREVTAALRGQPGILKADFTFGPYDVICEVQAPDLSSLGKLVSGTIRPTPGVIDTLTCLTVD
jgi:DNA-binding Lrp family transcriptional regulator